MAPGATKAPVQGHRGRLKDKYLDRGLDSLTDEEVVELLLTLATPRRDCKAAARAAVKAFGGLRGVLETDPAALANLDGLGRKNILGLRLVHDTARRFLRDRLLGRDFLHSAREVFDYLYHTLRDRKSEVVQVILLSAKNGVLGVEELFVGGVAASRIEPQVVIKRALEAGAAGLVLIHNHPSGDPAPSAGDQRVTRALTMAAAAVGLRLVDHLIVGENRYYSFAESGLIGRFEDEHKTLLLG